MSKEMSIVFVYDTQKCQSEADDPMSAVVYFHPSWVSDVHKLTLCGQLMGVSHFLELNFRAAKTIALQSGRFILKTFGRFVLAVGTDRNITEAALNHRADFLSAVVRLYHKDLTTVHDQCLGQSGNYKAVTDKFYHIFETYLPLLQHHNSVFTSVPVLKMTPSANCVFMDAMQTLQDCRQLKGVLGGTILYHNKIVATQLSPALSKQLVITDPYRIKTTAASITVPFHVPVGVQLIVVYIPVAEYQKLRNEASRAQNLFNSSVQSGGIIPFQMKRKIKRDKSLIFSNIPEEEVLPNLSTSNGDIVAAAAAAPTTRMGSSAKPRPTHLPLRMKNETARDIPESGFNSINFDEADSFPQFIGKTSICSTPLLENRVLHGNLLPICVNAAAVAEEEAAKLRETELTILENETNEISLSRLPNETAFNNVRENTFRKMTRSMSMRPLIKSLFSPVKKRRPKYCRYLTITDPSFPVFNDEGHPMSKCLYDACGIELGQDIAHEMEAMRIDGFEDADVMRVPNGGESDHVDIIDSLTNGGDKGTASATNGNHVAVNGNHVAVNGNHVGDTPLPPIAGTIVKDVKANGVVLRNRPVMDLSSTKERRKSLTLPIQPINLDPNPAKLNTPQQDDDSLDVCLDDPIKRRRADFPETPLRSKIMSQLPLDGTWSSGVSSCTMTPLTPIDTVKSFMRHRASIPKVDEENEEDLKADDADTGYQKVELFVCGQHDMAMLIVLEDQSTERSELVQSLWESCISRLPRIESSLQQTLNVNVDGVIDKSDMNYSFICLDPQWDVVHQGGHWTAEELQLLDDMHNDLKDNPTFTEILIRCSDSVIYSYRCGDTDVFYKQPGLTLRGIPQPADGMSQTSMNARRRLERDSIILL